MDLKALLLEAKQKVPPVLQVLHCGDESMLVIGGDCGVGGMTGTPGNKSTLHMSGWGVGWGHKVWGTEPGPVTMLISISLCPQMNEAVPSAGAWAIGSLTAPNSRPCRPNRSATSAARTTWLTAPWTSSRLSSLSKRPRSGFQLPPTHQTLDKKPASLAQLAWARLGLAACPLCLWNDYDCSPLSQLPLKHKPL